MATRRLPNHLLRYRKQSALSQEEIACLLGTQSGTKVCRYERFLREPGLHTALAYQAIFNRPVSELFPGLYEKIQREVRARAKTMSYKTSLRGDDQLTERKRQTLAAIAAVEAKNNSKQS